MDFACKGHIRESNETVSSCSYWKINKVSFYIQRSKSRQALTWSWLNWHFLSHHQTIEEDPIIVPYRVLHTNYPELPACQPQEIGWQATQPVLLIKLLWHTARQNNFQQDSFNFPTFALEKCIFLTNGRK